LQETFCGLFFCHGEPCFDQPGGGSPPNREGGLYPNCPAISRARKETCPGPGKRGPGGGTPPIWGKNVFLGGRAFWPGMGGNPPQTLWGPGNPHAFRVDPAGAGKQGGPAPVGISGGRENEGHALSFFPFSRKKFFQYLEPGKKNGLLGADGRGGGTGSAFPPGGGTSPPRTPARGRFHRGGGGGEKRVATELGT